MLCPRGTGARRTYSRVEALASDHEPTALLIVMRSSGLVAVTGTRQAAAPRQSRWDASDRSPETR